MNEPEYSEITNLNLEENSRPTLYRSLKYWGKKPHNIWRELIFNNTNIGDIVYDPFAGSALTFFESIKIGRKPIVADINPITLFLVELYSKQYNFEEIIENFKTIEAIVYNSEIYKKNFMTKCSNCGTQTDIYNYRWENDKLSAYSYKCKKCGKIITLKEGAAIYNQELNLWKPNYLIQDFNSTCKSSIAGFGGRSISDIWTQRNIEILSLIFDLLMKSNKNIHLPLLFAFLQTLHLTTKMCALRSEKTNRPLSTSWGRPAYMYLNNRMEQNPLIQFKRSLFEKNGVLKALESRNEYLPNYTFSQDINKINKVDGVVLLEDSKFVKGFNAELIITDPPYGSIIQYGELSMIWNVWLEKFDNKYKTDLKNEIIINKNNNYKKYCSDMTVVLSNCRRIISHNGLIIMTFNSNNIKDWNSINEAINQSGLCKKHQYLQKNKRSSEANVKATSEMSNSDYYFILQKSHKEKEEPLSAMA